MTTLTLDVAELATLRLALRDEPTVWDRAERAVEDALVGAIHAAGWHREVPVDLTDVELRAARRRLSVHVATLELDVDVRNGAHRRDAEHLCAVAQAALDKVVAACQ